MPPPRTLRLAPEWDERFTRSVGLSAAAHVLAVVAILVLAPLAARRPMPMTAYTVELTDPNALGGRLPPGPPARTLAGGPVAIAPPKGEPDGGAATTPPPAPEPPAEPAVEAKVAPTPEPPPKVEPKAEPKPEPRPEPKPEVAVTLPEKKVEPPKPRAEPKPEPKPTPKAEAKPEARPAAKPEPPKAAAKAEPRPAARADTAKPATATPPNPSAAAGRSAAAAGAAGAGDAYAKMAERWFKTQEGGGLGGTDRGGSGPIGSGGDGPGGGGQVVGLEFLAYQQRVITTVKAQWVNVVQRPGLVATVRFNIAPDGTVSGAQLVRSSGNAGYDQSVLRAVQVSNPLPRPPARYVSEFSEFEINFESQEKGGQGVG